MATFAFTLFLHLNEAAVLLSIDPLVVLFSHAFHAQVRLFLVRHAIFASSYHPIQLPPNESTQMSVLGGGGGCRGRNFLRSIPSNTKHLGALHRFVHVH